MDDQSIVGYTITAGYLLSSLLLFFSLSCRADCCESTGSKRNTLLWSVSAILSLLLGINKQLDLQTYLTNWGRDLFRNWGVYSGRRYAQLFASVIMVAMVAGAAIYGAFVIRRIVWSLRITIFGLAICMAYVVLRMISIHHVDHWLGVGVGGWKMSWIIELTGVAVTLIGAIMSCFKGENAFIDHE